MHFNGTQSQDAKHKLIYDKIARSSRAGFSKIIRTVYGHTCIQITEKR